MQQMQEMQRQAGIQSGTAAIDGLFNQQFDDNFFNQRREAALGYYMPQLDQQYGDARDQLKFALARGGNADSSAAAAQQGDLEQKYGTLRQSIADKARGFETNARNNIENARSGLIANLNATGDAQGAINSAQARLKALSAGDEYSPLADLFSTSLSLAGQQGALERADQMSGGVVGPRYRTGLFGPSNAVRNT
jgi:hypothetical protein